MPTEPDDLHKPLGLSADRSRAGFASHLRAIAAAAMIGAGVAALTFLAGEADHAGEPFATASIEPVAPPSNASALGAREADEKGGDDERATATASEIEADSGVVVVRPDGAPAPGAMVIRVPDAPGAAKLAAAPDARLVERSDFGPLPRIGGRLRQAGS